MVHRRDCKIVTPKDEWGTPDALFKQLDDEFHFKLDAAATQYNRKCRDFFNKEVDSLKVSWGYKSVYLNPPYSQGNIDKFMAKAVLEGNKMDNGEYVVCLVPVASDTQWWHNYAMKAKEIRFIEGRVKFIGYDSAGNAVNNSPTFSSCICIFSSWHGEYWNQPSYRDDEGNAYLTPILGKPIRQRKKR